MSNMSNMSEDPDIDVEADAAMREAMGFGSFATRRPKNQSGKHAYTSAQKDRKTGARGVQM